MFQHVDLQSDFNLCLKLKESYISHLTSLYYTSRLCNGPDFELSCANFYQRAVLLKPLSFHKKNSRVCPRVEVVNMDVYLKKSESVLSCGDFEFSI